MDIVLRILSESRRGIPQGAIGVVRLLYNENGAPNRSADVFVNVIARNTPYQSLAQAEVLMSQHIVQVQGLDGLETSVQHERRFVLNPAQAEPHTVTDLTEVGLIDRDWSVLRPAIIDLTTGTVATDAALGLV